MTKREIVDGYVDAYVPGLTGYAYQATTWCVDCGPKIARRLIREWVRTCRLAAITHHDLCDTEQFPVPISYDDVDYCDHCGEVTR